MVPATPLILQQNPSSRHETEFPSGTAAKDMKVMKEAFFKEDLYGVTVRLGEIEPR